MNKRTERWRQPLAISPEDLAKYGEFGFDDDNSPTEKVTDIESESSYNATPKKIEDDGTNSRNEPAIEPGFQLDINGDCIPKSKLFPISTSSSFWIDALLEELSHNPDGSISQEFMGSTAYEKINMQFESFKGRQLHILNQLFIFITRQYFLFLANFKNSSQTNIFMEQPDFSIETIKKYFPNAEESFIQLIAFCLQERMKQTPKLNLNTSQSKLSSQRRIQQSRLKKIDPYQITIDVWRDWVKNQDFRLKKGVFSSNPSLTKKKYELIWQNTSEEPPSEMHNQNLRSLLEKRAHEIEATAIVVLNNWRLIIGDENKWVKNADERTDNRVNKNETDRICSLLLDIHNTVVFEKLILLRYFVTSQNDYEEVGAETIALLGGALSAALDAIIKVPQSNNELKIVVVDFKSKLESDVSELETLLTKMIAYYSLSVKPGSLKPVEVDSRDVSNTELTDQINAVEVHHIMPTQIIESLDKTLDFHSAERKLWITQQAFHKLNIRILQAHLHSGRVTFSLRIYKGQNRTPVINECKPINKIGLSPSKTLPNISTELEKTMKSSDQSLRYTTFDNNPNPEYHQLSFDIKTPVQASGKTVTKLQEKLGKKPLRKPMMSVQ